MTRYEKVCASCWCRLVTHYGFIILMFTFLNLIKQAWTVSAVFSDGASISSVKIKTCILDSVAATMATRLRGGGGAAWESSQRNIEWKLLSYFCLCVVSIKNFTKYSESSVSTSKSR